MGRNPIPACKLRIKVSTNLERQHDEFISRVARTQGTTATALREKILVDWCRRNGMKAK
jgi:hypothetical protein